MVYVNEELGELLYEEIRKEHFKKMEKEVSILELEFSQWRGDKENYFFK